MTLFRAKALFLDPPDERQARARTPFSENLEKNDFLDRRFLVGILQSYLNSSALARVSCKSGLSFFGGSPGVALGTIWELLWVSLGVSWESLGSPGGLLGALGSSLATLGSDFGPHFAGPWAALATTGVPFGNIFGVFGLLLGSTASLLHAVGRCEKLLQFHFGFRRSRLQEPPGDASRWSLWERCQ